MTGRKWAAAILFVVSGLFIAMGTLGTIILLFKPTYEINQSGRDSIFTVVRIDADPLGVAALSAAGIGLFIVGLRMVGRKRGESQKEGNS